MNESVWQSMYTELGTAAYYAGRSQPYGGTNFRLFKDVNEAENAVKHYAIGNTGKDGISPVDQYAQLDGDPVIHNDTPLSVGNHKLENNTNQAINLSTPGFTYKKTYKTSATTTHAFDLGFKQTTTIKIPLFTSQTEVSAKYSFSHNGTIEESEEVTYTVPPQPIPTLPGHTYKVEYILTIGKATGNVDFYGDVKGTMPILAGKEPFTTPYLKEVGEAIILAHRSTHPNTPNWSKKEDDIASYKGGGGTYEASYGSDFYMKVSDITEDKADSEEDVQIYQIKNLKLSYHLI